MTIEGADEASDGRELDGDGRMIDFSNARRAMVDGQLRTNDVTNSDLLDVFTIVPREIFVDPAEQSVAYADRSVAALGGTGRQILAPMIFGRMIQAAELKSGSEVLDIAGGSGYSAALMAALGARVTVQEDQEQQAEAAKQALHAAGVDGVSIAVGPLTTVHRSAVQYDAILIHGRCETVPDGLLRQLKNGGRLICLFGSGVSAIVRVYTASDGAIGEKRLMSASGPLLPAFARVNEFVF